MTRIPEHKLTPAHTCQFRGCQWALRSGLEAAPGQPLLLYNLACYHSLAGDVTAAVDHLTRAISIDDRFRELTGNERDFDPIRGDPRFVAATHVVV